MATGRRPLVQIVPNFSEGRRRDVIDAIVGALQVPGVVLVNTQWDPDHNRLDCSLIGDPDAVRRSALAGAAKAVELIDMQRHHGGHPRMGAVDVIPFIPVRDITMEECVELARGFAREIAGRLSLPVYCYDWAALTPDRASLAEVRKGEYEGLRADVEAGRRLPDFGPHELGAAGAVAVGARKPLVAFNVYLAGDDEQAAKDVARAVRGSSGGLRDVRAIGFAVPERGCVTVSMNLVDTEATPIHRAFELVKIEAARFGLRVLDSEIVGLVPQAALADGAAFYLQLKGFDPAEQVLENLVARADAAAPADGEPGPIAGRTVGGFLDELASQDPTPGGGSTAAVAAAAGASLVAMVGRLTVGKRKYEEVEARMRSVVDEADAARQELLALADRDAEAFDAVMAAYRLPKETDEQAAARSAAIQGGLLAAAELPLSVARRAVALMDLAREVTETGNANAASDGAAGAALLFAGAQGALRNVEINVAGMEDPRAEPVRVEAADLDRQSRDLLDAATAAFRGRVAAG